VDILRAIVRSAVRFLISTLAGLAAAAFAGPVAADDAGPSPKTRAIAEAVTLGEARCFDRARLGAAVAVWLGRGEIDARLSIEAGHSGARARFTLRRDGRALGSRVLSVPGAACEDVRAALGLAIAVAIDATVLAVTNIADVPEGTPASVIAPPAAAGEAPPAPEGIAPAPAEAGSEARSAAVIAPSPTATARGAAQGPRRAPERAAIQPKSDPSHRADRLTIRAEGGLGVDLLTSPVFVGEAGLSLRVLPALSLQAGVLATSAARAEVAGGGAVVQLAAGTADTCTGGQLGRVHLFAYFGAALGSMWAHGFGFSPSNDASAVWLALDTRVGASARLTERLSLNAGVTVLALPYRMHLEVLSSGAVTRSLPLPPIAVALTAGPSFVLW